MEQLQYHGKKTVPAAIRRDMWTPYFSIKFPPTDFGADSGQIAYRRLRELSLQRQLSPPTDMVTTTQEDIDKLKLKTNPVDIKTMLDERDIRLPVVGQRLPKKMRAKRLMDQKATAVADVAFVLHLYLEGLTPKERVEMRVARFNQRMSNMGRRGRSRLQKIKLLEARKRDYIKALASQVRSISDKKGHLPLDKHAAARLSSEYQGKITASGGLTNLVSIESAKAERATEAEIQGNIADVQAQIDALLTGQQSPSEALPTKKRARPVKEAEPLTDVKSVGANTRDRIHAMFATKKISDPVEETEALPTVKVMWADMRDGTYASEWPEAVLHGELERWATSAKVGGSRERNIHVIGAEEGSGWAGDTEKLFGKLSKRDEDHERRVKVADALSQPVANLEGNALEEAIRYAKEEQERERTRPRVRRPHKDPQGHKTDERPMIRICADLRARLEAAGVSAREQELTSTSLEWHWENLEEARRLKESEEAAGGDTASEQKLTNTALGWHRKNLKHARQLNDTKKIALLQAQILMLPEEKRGKVLRPVGKAEVPEGTKREVNILREEEGVEVDLPKSGLFDRLKAKIWRR